MQMNVSSFHLVFIPQVDKVQLQGVSVKNGPLLVVFKGAFILQIMSLLLYNLKNSEIRHPNLQKITF